MKRWYLWGILLLAGMLTGCAFLNSDSTNFLFPTDEADTGSANVKLKIVSSANESLETLSAIRLNQTGLRATVMFRLILIFPGNQANQVKIIQKIVDVDEMGRAETSFSGVPATTVIGQIQINGGSLNGKTDFHGGVDLVSGDNLIELAPIGSEHSADLTAKVLLDIVKIPELIKAAPKTLVSSLQTTLKTSINLSLSGSELYSDALDRFISSPFFNSLEFIKLTVTSNGGLKAEEGAVELWNKAPEKLLEGIADVDGLSAARIIRQNYGADLKPVVLFLDSSKRKFAIATINLTAGSIDNIFVADSTTLSSVSSVIAANDFVILAAVAQGVPVLCRWNISSSVQTGWPIVGNSSVPWASIFPNIIADSKLPYPKVELLSFNPEDGKSVQCVVRDPKTLLLQNYHVTSDGVLEARQPAAAEESLKWPLVAIPGVNMNTLVWDEIPGADHYTIYWSETADIPLTGTNVRSFSHVNQPFVHTGLIENRTYNYLLTWAIGGVEKGPSRQASATTLVGNNAKKFRIIYVGNGHNLGFPPIDPVLYEAGSETVILGNTGQLEKTNYPFVGWSGLPDGLGKTFLPDEKFQFGTYDLVLYAKWHEFAGGSGTAEDPYLVATADQLNKVRKYRDCHFKQILDIDLADFLRGSESGWSPIGANNVYVQEPAFSGSYDGNSKKIKNLFIYLPDRDHVGLFGLTADAEIKNLDLENADVRGRGSVGILAGAPAGTKIINCRSSGIVNGGACGGLSGACGSTDNNDCFIQDCFSSATVSGKGVAGGLICAADAVTIVSSCSYSGIITSEGYAGGIIGYLWGLSAERKSIVKDCFAEGEVYGKDWVGGLVGYTSFAEVLSSHASGKVRGKSGVGGLVGLNTSVITDCFADSTVEGESMVGGLVGKNTFGNESGSIARCFATGAVVGNNYAGGFVGMNNVTVADSYSKGSVSGQNSIGGFCGNNNGDFARCYAVGLIKVENTASQIGGFCGENAYPGTFVNSFWDVLTTGCATSFGGVGLTTEEMWKQSTYTVNGWDFNSTWKMNEEGENYPYPVLR